MTEVSQSLSAALPYWLDRPPSEALEVARAAEAAGIEELWIGEMATFDAFALAGALAVELDQIRLAIGPVPVALRDPLTLAMGVSSIRHLSGRPVTLMLGASSPTVVADWHGVDTAPTRQLFRESLALCRAILDGERSDFAGETVRSHGFRVRLESDDIRLGMAAFGPRMLDLAGEVADRVALAHVTPTLIGEARQRIDASAAKAGRPAPELCVWMSAGLDETDTAQIARALTIYVPQPGYGEMFAKAGFGDIVELARSGVGPKRVLEELPEGLLAAVAGTGGPDAIARGMQERWAAGADRVVIIPATAGTGSAIDVLAAAYEAAR
ncbi:MAG: LLM class F420-dependent oxidoreductase [Acidimicrobiales bacterium]